MQIHRKVNDASLQVVRHFVDDHLRADVDQFDIGQMWFGDSLVHFLVVTDPIPKVSSSYLRVLADVVRGRGLDFKNIMHNKVLVIAFALDKHDIVTSSLAALLNPGPSLTSRVGCIKDTNVATPVLEPMQHVSNGRFGRSATETFPLSVPGVEKVSGGLGGIRTAIGTDIERLRIDREPFKIAHNYR